MTTSEELRARVAEDTARSREITAKRDAVRARTDRGAAIEDVRAGKARLVPTSEFAPGDITSDGHLVGKTRFRITGWKTRDEKEAGTEREATHPVIASSFVRALLEDGHYQVIVDVSS